MSEPTEPHGTTPHSGGAAPEPPETVADGPSASNAVCRARGAFQTWKQRSLYARARRLGRLRRWLTEHLDEVVRYIIEDTGKPDVEALAGDLLVTVQFIEYYENNAPEMLRDEPRSAPFPFVGDAAEVQHRPHGVVGVVSPWNYPLQLTLVPAITALVAGNAVVIKPAVETPRISDLLEQLNQILGGPDALLEVVRGGDEAGERLVEAGPDMIFFTGSVEAGKEVRRRAVDQMIPVELELGGKDPMIVCSDANISRAARAAAWGGFSNAGQACVSIERVYVQSPVFESFLSELLDETGGLTVGSGPDADVGPMIRDKQVERVRRHVEGALADGATLQTPFTVEGRRVHPVVLTDVSHDMEVMREETFGPVLCVVPFETDRDAVRMANDTRYGLNAGVFSGDEQRARRIANRLDVGACFINNVITNVGNPALPFGGNNASGIGRYHGPEGLYAFTKTTSVMRDGWPMDREVNWFPYSRSFYDLLSDVIRLRFGEESFPDKLRRAVRMLGRWLARD